MGGSITEINENSQYPKQARVCRADNQNDTHLHPIRRQAALCLGSWAKQRLHGLLTNSFGRKPRWTIVSRMVNLTMLAPDIVAAILDDALPGHITLFDLAVDPPALWEEQRERVGL